VIYVDVNVSGGNNDGSSWVNAYKHLQDALSAATPNSGDQIWVTAGTYYPDRTTANPSGTGARTATFQPINGVTLYGGFDGAETQLTERDWENNVTILSGDLAQNDSSDFGNRGDNSHHVLVGSGTDNIAILDGFTVSGGNADTTANVPGGGGLFCDGGSPTIRYCIFRDNRARDGGGVFLQEDSDAIFQNCVFEDNLAFFDNVFGGVGGGMDCLINSEPPGAMPTLAWACGSQPVASSTVSRCPPHAATASSRKREPCHPAACPLDNGSLIDATSPVIRHYHGGRHIRERGRSSQRAVKSKPAPIVALILPEYPGSI